MTVTIVSNIILITRSTEKTCHLNVISRIIFWANGTALFLFMEKDRIEASYSTLSFEIPAGGSLDNNKDDGQTYCVLADQQISRNATSSPGPSQLFKMAGGRIHPC